MEFVVGILTVIVSSIVAFLLARKYGDLAGTKAAIEFEKEKYDKARLDALNSLLHEVERARSLADHNLAIDPTGKGPRSVVHMPVTAFETVFLSGDILFPLTMREQLPEKVWTPYRLYETRFLPMSRPLMP